MSWHLHARFHRLQTFGKLHYPGGRKIWLAPQSTLLLPGVACSRRGYSQIYMWRTGLGHLISINKTATVGWPFYVNMLSLNEVQVFGYKAGRYDTHVWISVRIWPRFLPDATVYNKSALVQILAWRLRDDEPISEAMMVYFTDACMRHSAPMSFISTSPWRNLC